MAEHFSSQEHRNPTYDYGTEGIETAHREGGIARRIEEQTAKLPSDLFLWSAGAVVLGSVLLRAAGRRDSSMLISQIAPMLLIMGLYNKVVKVGGSDRMSG